MWEQQEEEALYIGLSLHDYWELNPKEFTKHINAYTRKIEDSNKRVDSLNHILGYYVSYAFSDEKYPDKPLLQDTKEDSVAFSDIEKMAEFNTLVLGGEIKKRGGKK